MTKKRYLMAIIILAVSTIAGIGLHLIRHQVEEPRPTPMRAENSKPAATVNGVEVYLYFTGKYGIFLTAESRSVPHSKDPAILGRHIIQALIKTRGIVGGAKGAARLLVLPRSSLQYRLKKFGINPGDYVKD